MHRLNFDPKWHCIQDVPAFIIEHPEYKYWLYYDFKEKTMRWIINGHGAAWKFKLKEAIEWCDAQKETYDIICPHYSKFNLSKV